MISTDDSRQSPKGGRGSLGTKVLFGSALSVGLLLATAGIAGAEEAPKIAGSADTQTITQGVSIMWIVISAALVIFMQAGFALVETGFCRAKHAAHVVSTNFAIFGLGFVAYYLLGFGFMFGGYSDTNLDSSVSLFGLTAPVGKALIGSGNWTFLWGGGNFLTDLRGPGGAAVAAYFLYMVAFMDTTATIPTGAMAERWKWKAFVGWGLFCGAIYYPLFGAWTWGGGWLAKLGNSSELGFGYVDFAGSGVVHAMGGVAGLAGAMVLGPRIGKFNKDGSANAMPGHHLPMAMLGTFILLFGWFGFNAGSTLSGTDVQFAVVATNTALAGAFGAVVSMLYMMYVSKVKKPDPGMMVNGMLAGLVAITAPCAFVDPYAAAIIGSVAGVIVIWSIAFFEKRGIDDPVGAISVHGVCGLFGVLCVGLFANGTYGAGWNLTTEGAAGSASGVTGIFTDFSLGIRQLGAQAIGCVVIATVMFAFAFAFFKIQDAITKGGIRSEEADEIDGLDESEMGVFAYPEFHMAADLTKPTLEQPAEAPRKVGV